MGRVIRHTQPTGKIAEIGKIKVGDKKVNAKGNEYPVSLDYFRATGDYAKLFTDTFGDKCTSIPIVFASDDTDTVCNEEYVVRDKGGRLVATGDGQQWSVYDAKSEKYLPRKASVEEMAKLGDLKLTLTLRFLIVDIKVLGYWRFETRGEASTIPQVRDTFDYVRAQAGTICSIPFDLKIKKVKSQKPGVASSFPVVSLVANLSTGSMERLSNFVTSGSVPRGLLTEDKLNGIAELPAASIEVEPEAEVFTAFEEVGPDNELDQAVSEMLAFTVFKDAAAHWKAHKEFQENPEYIKAKETVKQKIESNGINEQSNPVG